MKTKIVSEQNLLSAGWVSNLSIQAGTAIKYLSSEYPNGYLKASSDDFKGELVPATTPHLEQVREVLTEKFPPLCTVDGVAVDELAVLVKPVAFFVTTEHGTHEVSRCYYQRGKFQYGVDMQRLGGIGTRSAEYQPGRGLLIHFEHGYEMFIPMSHCQATWRLPAQ